MKWALLASRILSALAVIARAVVSTSRTRRRRK